MYFVKRNVEKSEYLMHKHIHALNIVNTPKIIEYENKTLVMEKINNMNISDLYGSCESDVPEYIFDEIREIITLLDFYGIVYPDITGYNFIEYENKIWILDFEHAYFKKNKNDDFVSKFINGLNMWNPEFK